MALQLPRPVLPVLLRPHLASWSPSSPPPPMHPVAGEGPGHIWPEPGVWTEPALTLCLRMLVRPLARSGSNSPGSAQHLDVTGKWVTDLSLASLILHPTPRGK